MWHNGTACFPSCAHKKINLGILPGLMTVLTKGTSFGGISYFLILTTVDVQDSCNQYCRFLSTRQVVQLK